MSCTSSVPEQLKSARHIVTLTVAHAALRHPPTVVRDRA
jgi:hypothetical protein